MSLTRLKHWLKHSLVIESSILEFGNAEKPQSGSIEEMGKKKQNKSE